MVGASLLRLIRDTHALVVQGPVTAAELAPRLDDISRHIRRLTALPSRDNAALRELGKRMDGWLHSIHSPDVIRSRPLLLMRLQMLARTAHEVDVIEEERADAVAEAVATSKVVRFPGALERGLRRAQVQA